MKQATSICIAMVLVLGCVSNPITEENYSEDKEPMQPMTAAMWSMIPGAGQFLLGEYVEGVLYIAGMVIPSVIGIIDPWKEVYGGWEYPSIAGSILLSVGLVGGMSFSAIDAYASAQKMQQQHQEIRRNRYIENNPDIDPRIRNAINSENIILGMTQEQVIMSLGKPDDINRTVGEWGVHEQWIYGTIPYSRYLYFENYKLTSMQD